jgi:UMF1 family MFS transporter
MLYPILTSIADTGAIRRISCAFSAIWAHRAAACCISSMGRTCGWASGCFILASMGFVGSLVFYNAYLPEIAAPADQDAVSAKGFAYGYIGSVILH